ncbi:Uncharacterized protein APZ42_004241 [Daphnia magna]|uniref:Uncharacterized protein n=1 Tax=Daphnia magna TaxID=35525 RepID=A0A164H6H6_9CRUS|nr:Uncharacterized protein APZ42_004241 [Daphnia magna]
MLLVFRPVMMDRFCLKVVVFFLFFGFFDFIFKLTLMVHAMFFPSPPLSRLSFSLFSSPSRCVAPSLCLFSSNHALF